jgi:hypothetical protein
MPNQAIILEISPLIIGGIIAIVNQPTINNFIESLEDLIRDQQRSSSMQRGLGYRFLLHPLLFILVRLNDLTNSISSISIKSGIRIALYLYFIGIWIYLFTAAFTVIITLIVCGFVLFLVLRILSVAFKNN